MPPSRPGRVGFLMVMLGLLVQIAATLFWGPAMFIFSAVVGLPLVLGGAVSVFITARRVRVQGTGPGPHAPA
jgi:hypothetical protein